jgi:hypothetical protein
MFGNRRHDFQIQLALHFLKDSIGFLHVLAERGKGAIT